MPARRRHLLAAGLCRRPREILLLPVSIETPYELAVFWEMFHVRM
jgi:hypothetical protein